MRSERHARRQTNGRKLNALGGVLFSYRLRLRRHSARHAPFGLRFTTIRTLLPVNYGEIWDIAIKPLWLPDAEFRGEMFIGLESCSLLFQGGNHVSRFDRT